MQVCVYESMCAGVRRLLDEGIHLVGRIGFFDPVRIEQILGVKLQSLVKQRKER